ncbi:MAG TPA: hypothetical protein VHN14_36770 [Kofleriaceae bacterium]|jgi:hypothetical protein|nr:hypothetical protein [Kofleriaceae bacterium]
MKAIRVRVENGRISGDAPPGLPEGEADLCLAEGDDDMSEADLARLDDALRPRGVGRAQGRRSCAARSAEMGSAGEAPSCAHALNSGFA